MKPILTSGALAALFAFGLVFSGMTRPDRVLGFLDVFGSWDPTLLFVMIGAIPTFSFFYQISQRRKRPLFEEKFDHPSKTKLDARLILGSALFGIGWGLSGYCPGPAIVSLGAGSRTSLLFVANMMLGMAAFRFFELRKKHK